jgi:Family of unknown function (DUF6263)
MDVFARRMPLSLLALAGALALAAAQEKDKGKETDKTKEGATLDWKFERDKPFYQTMTTKTQQTMKVMGSDVPQNQEQTFYFEWKPTEVKDDTVTLKQKIVGLKMNIDIGGSKIAFDSTSKENPANNPLNKFFEALNGVEFTLTLDRKQMKVTRIEGAKDFVEKLGGANPQMKPLLEKILSEKALMEMSDPLFAALPGKKVKKGESWDRKSSLDMGPLGKYDTTYTYTSDGPDKDQKFEKIGVKTDLKYTPPESAAQGGLPFQIKQAELKASDATGTVLYDPKAGRVESYEVGMTLTGKLTIVIGQQSTEVDLTQKQTTKIETSDKDPSKPK